MRQKQTVSWNRKIPMNRLMSACCFVDQTHHSHRSTAHMRVHDRWEWNICAQTTVVPPLNQANLQVCGTNHMIGMAKFKSLSLLCLGTSSPRLFANIVGQTARPARKITTRLHKSSTLARYFKARIWPKAKQSSYTFSADILFCMECFYSISLPARMRCTREMDSHARLLSNRMACV